MIYSIFVYNTESGLLMWDKSFEDISHGKMELFSSFFSAIKSFIQEMVLKGGNELKTIEMGNYLLKVQGIPKIGIDIVVISDKEDLKKLNKMIPDLEKVLMEKGTLFKEWNGEKRMLAVLDQPLLNIINNAKLSTNSSSIVDNQSEVLRSIWSKKGVLDTQILENCKKERELLKERYPKATTILNKIGFMNSILELDQKLCDDKQFLVDQALKLKLDKEFEDIKMKLKYFAQQVKSKIYEIVQKAGSKSFKEMDYRDAYSALFSFSGKLKAAGMDEKADQFRSLSKALIDKDLISETELYDVISKILKIDDNIDILLS
jgi:hypothetical protein